VLFQLRIPGLTPVSLLETESVFEFFTQLAVPENDHLHIDSLWTAHIGYNQQPIRVEHTLSHPFLRRPTWITTSCEWFGRGSAISITVTRGALVCLDANTQLRRFRASEYSLSRLHGNDCWLRFCYLFFKARKKRTIIDGLQDISFTMPMRSCSSSLGHQKSLCIVLITREAISLWKLFENLNL
jgi:hypothetical protein